jgi:hypothetical protein
VEVAQLSSVAVRMSSCLAEARRGWRSAGRRASALCVLDLLRAEQQRLEGRGELQRRCLPFPCSLPSDERRSRSFATNRRQRARFIYSGADGGPPSLLRRPPSPSRCTAGSSIYAAKGRRDGVEISAGGAPCAGEEQGLYLAGLLLSFLGYILAAAEERDEQDGARVFVVLAGRRAWLRPWWRATATATVSSYNSEALLVELGPRWTGGAHGGGAQKLRLQRARVRRKARGSWERQHRDRGGPSRSLSIPPDLGESSAHGKIP